MVFIKAMKSLAIAISLLPLGGCAIALGILFGNLLKAESYSPDMGTSLFNRSMLAFALIELNFVVIVIIVFYLTFAY